MPDGFEVKAIPSPDGSFRVECITEPDERAPAWQRTRIVRQRDGKEILMLSLHTLQGKPEFPAPGVVIVSLLSRYGKHEWLRVNVDSETFVKNASEPEQPLSTIFSRLDLPDFGKPWPGLKKDMTIREQLFNIFLIYFGAIAVAGGSWMALTAKNTSDRAAGALGVILFGAGAVYAIVELRRQAQRRKERRAAGNTTPSERLWLRWRPYLPLIVCLFQAIWFVLVVAGLFFVAGDEPFSLNSSQEKLLDVVACLPAFAGLAVGVTAFVRRWATTIAAWIALLLGSAICAALICALVFEIAR